MLLAVLERGAHGTKGGFLGWPFADDDRAPAVIAEFVAACAAEAAAAASRQDGGVIAK